MRKRFEVRKLAPLCVQSPKRIGTQLDNQELHEGRRDDATPESSFEKVVLCHHETAMRDKIGKHKIESMRVGGRARERSGGKAARIDIATRRVLPDQDFVPLPLREVSSSTGPMVAETPIRNVAGRLRLAERTR